MKELELGKIYDKSRENYFFLKNERKKQKKIRHLLPKTMRNNTTLESPFKCVNCGNSFGELHLRDSGYKCGICIGKPHRQLKNIKVMRV